jgi:hypothetical protein
LTHCKLCGTVWASNFSHAATLSALYRPLVSHMLPISMNCMVMNAFKGTINLKSLIPGHQLEFKPQRHWRVKSIIFWDMMPCNLVDCYQNSSALKMVNSCFSKIPACIYWSPLCHIQRNCNNISSKSDWKC